MPGRQPEHPAGGTWWRRLLAAVGLARPHCGAKPTPAEDMAVAYRAVSDGDLPHAAFHVACALYAGDPNDRKALALLDRLVGDTQKSGGDPLALAPLKRDNYAGTVAVRARILAHLGQYREAFNLLAQVQHADRARPLWRWAAEWATRPGAAAQAEPGMAGVLLASAVGRHGGVRVEDPAARAELEAILPAAEALSGAHPGDEKLRWMHCAILRKIGRVAEAARLSEAAWESGPSYATAIALAMARSAAGDVDGAVKSYVDALKFDPDDAAARADAALALHEARRWEAALAFAEAARKHDPKQETAATPLSFLLRYRLGQGPQWLESLAAFAARHPTHGWTSNILGRLQWYVDFLPDPAEATIGLLKNMVEQGAVPRGAGAGKPEDFEVSVSSIEAPSARTAVEMTLRMPPGSANIDVGGIPSPDPREPIGPVDYLLWRYEGSRPVAAVPAPPPDVAAAVAELARRPFDVDEWTARAAEVAAQLRPRATVEALLGVMVRPPPAPDVAGRLQPRTAFDELSSVTAGPPPQPEKWMAWNWIRAVQFAATLVLSKWDGGWVGSVRRKALLSLARGPVDWTTEAAITALGQVCREETLPAEAKEEIVAVLRELANALPDRGHCCYPYALAAAVMRLPFPTEQLRPKFSPLWRYVEGLDAEAE